MIHEQVNNPPFNRLRALRNLDGPSGSFDMLKAPREIEGLRLRPAIAGRRPSTGSGSRAESRDSGIALRRPRKRPVETYRCDRGRTCRRIIHEGTPFVNNAGQASGDKSV